MATSTGASKAQKKQPTQKELREREQKYLANAEAKLVAKHNTKREKVVPGSIKRGSGVLQNKLTVKINTLGEDGKPDGNTRVVATSDVHQVEHQPEVAEALRRAARNERARAARAAKAAAKA